MHERPVIGIFGAGKVGTALARLLMDPGTRCSSSGSPRQTALDLLVSVVAPGARVVTADELVDGADVIIVGRAVRQGPQRAVARASAGASWSTP